MTAGDFDTLLESAREAARNGEHAQTIAICTRILDEQPLAAAQRIELLDVRAESYIAQGQLDMAQRDVGEMRHIADDSDNPAFMAIALNRQAWEGIVRGDLNEAIFSATTAVDAAREVGDRPILASCLHALAVAHRKARHVEPVFKAAREAVDLFRELGDRVGEGRVLCWLALYYLDIGNTAELHRTLDWAERLCRQTGDQYGLGGILHIRAVQEPNIALSIKHHNEALKAFRSSGYVERQALILSSLAATYNSLGLYRHARRLAVEAQAITRQVGALMVLGWATGARFTSEIGLGNGASARQALDDKIQIAATLDTPYWDMGVEEAKAEIALLENDPATAAEHLTRILFQDHAVSDVDTFDRLADVYLAMGDVHTAVQSSTRAIELLGDEEVGEYVFQRIWWNYSRVLAAAGETELAEKALQQAHRYLIRAAANIADEGLRRSFFNKVPYNRQLIDDWIAYGREQSLTIEAIFAHLDSQADAREPFHRLVDTGLRLNQQRKEEELVDFLIDEAAELIGAERLLLVLGAGKRLDSVASLMPSGEDPEAVLNSLGDQLEQAQQTRTVLLEAAESPDSPTPSRITAPLIAQNRVLGFLFAEMDARYGSFNQVDADLLGMLASQGAVALENVRLVEGLEEQVEERTAELREANKQAEEARQIAEQANQAKSRFLANMSHELRTPLNAIIGFTRIVKRKARGKLEEKQVDNLGKVQSSAEHLLSLINTILDIAKIEAGGMDVHAADFEVAPLIELCLSTAQPFAKPGVEMKAEIEPDLPVIYSDADKIKQILLNLLSNAAKFTHNGTITIYVGAVREPPLLEIRVIDTGIGMNEEQLARVFEEFQQADATTTRKYGGTGLGLPISKRLAQLLGGDLTATSAQGEGSTFQLTLPLIYAQEEKAR